MFFSAKSQQKFTCFFSSFNILKLWQIFVAPRSIASHMISNHRNKKKSTCNRLTKLDLAPRPTNTNSIIIYLLSFGVVTFNYDFS